MATNPSKSKTPKKRIFYGTEDKVDAFDLIQVQKDSWQEFLDTGLFSILHEFFPIEDYTKKNFRLELKDVYFGEPRYTLAECIEKKLSYYFPVYVKVSLFNKRKNTEKTQDVYFFNLPKMTDRGTFVINGIERAVISQISRSPGIYFTAEVDKVTGATVYNAEVRPYIGSWLDFTITKNNLIEAKINKRRKFLATSFLRSFKDMSNNEIISLFSDIDKDIVAKFIVPTLERDGAKTRDEAVLEIYKKLRPGEPLVLNNAYETLDSLFFNPRRYTLSNVGRYKINKKLNLDTPIEKENFVLTLKDAVATIKYLINLTTGKGNFDDIDHLANRRIRTVGELIGMYGVRVGMVRTERDIKARMSMTMTDVDTLPSQIINSKSLIATINSFYRTSQLSTIVDQTNPLSEIDNLRRLTVGGPGGLEKERASFSIRDISSSQYGRICPIRSPEGPNIGVVTYMALYAKINKFGFVETPYKKIIHTKKGNNIISKVGNEITYMQSDDEEIYHITHSSIEIDENGVITQERVPARFGGDMVEVSADKIDFIDISPRQVVGLAASLIPFIQHDDASRALMGTHMLCQAVPLVKPQAPVVGTGMEATVATALGRTIMCPEDATVEYVDGRKIVLKGKSGKNHQYDLNRFMKTNKDVVFDQRPLVSMGQSLKAGDAMIDGPATDHGQLSLGQNLVVAYASLDGLGYEDGFVISQRLVKDDVFTSVVMEEFIADLVDTKLGPEELTRDIPNVREEILANLDKDGLVIVGSEIAPGDVLIGKVAPKGEKELSAEERLLRAIFGEKAKDVKDTSLRMPYGKKGVVVDVKIIDAKKDPNELEPGVLKRIIVTLAQLRKIKVGDKLAGRHGNKGIISKILPAHDMPYLEDGTPVDVVLSTPSMLARMNLGQLFETMLGGTATATNSTFSIPVFEPISEKIISDQLEAAGFKTDGKVKLFDGRTGMEYEKPVLVGVGYILKLVHMVEDKFHARSTGPYSLVTQQPLGGKSQMGGQRFGEMEVWALEAHRVPHTLQEMLTIKSDDVQGRRKAFEAIIKGIDIPQSAIPESFNVLTKELNALGLNVEAID
ncbi:DNA-directed RNA polymerase subunit beta [Candidatus Roizmanbacteria bacterium RIFCSPHIGHO2_02_FULL_40_13b]|uniref:DNA-directed RNA polymerase subunit beta n=1 Tax=Candidatus Roizmanbacteria bacterium RIFCSPHIGHO2_01_FULL_39_24 TaxID=1802032 RepID=A0A1F7GLR1_9BACT|nr:MAG: DNA-directed RNA polymerase subunit beta [Candidatus Roizmanbacteria bacterium RIFCSPHIGHO2_01_FULL_39_24]OGK26886.1 MAG: DNA-directed RNA polymerase subunit beta [Candidatus Roizmanbacteria bacterium RIFCSPHIGHO2_02_FULL_40_13b]OGK49365.1 MAG: DNA-directed RNA polymerase subunit beta [Candidatus Roizmanbacteria bacterium RIFCSPLOWO2_01_FULL_40_32]